jgi:PAS domain S-box-containing protein
MQKRRLFEYAVSVLAVLTAVAITVLSEPWIARQTLFVFLGAVILSTIYGGLIPGLLALGLAAIATALVVIAPLNQFRMDDGLPRWILFQIVAFIVILIIASRRNVMIRLGESSERLRLALEVARTGVWDYSRETGQLWMSQGLITMLGYPESQAFTYDEFLKAVHPEDREIFSQALDRIVNDKVDYETDFRIVRPDGAVRYLVMRGRSYASMFGGARRIVGVVTDRTNLMPAVSVTGRKLVQSSADPVQSI